MKKFICFVLLSLLLGTLCLAEGVDLSSLSDADLLVLKDRVEAEIIVRNGGISFVPWKEFCAGRILPDPSVILGKDTYTDYGIHLNRDNSFNDTFIANDENDFYAYCEACIAAGFTDVSDMSKILFEAKSTDGKKLRITHFTENCLVDLEIE